MSVAGILKNNLLDERVYNVEAIDEMFDGVVDQSDIDASISTHNTSTTAHNDIRLDIAAANAKIEHLESLGQVTVPGAFATLTARPANISGFSVEPTVNDYTFITSDASQSNKTTLYVIDSIDGSGDISWSFVKAFDQDMTGKIDVVAGATEDTIAVFNATGGIKAQQYKVADLLWEFEPLP